jgi:ATP-dependent helicase/nuclease subunit B
MGYSREEKILPRVQKYHSWEQLSREWKTEAESLGKSFASGEAGVDPKRGLAVTCRFCDLQTLCRVYEKSNPLKEEEEETDE